ncbi:MAG: hypothetical protein CL927_18295 [Deltaproteobacteria bacterium]|nr:hypothetical protein [Deltaproteobacteria bacterium]HCH63779.1 hypothetical protein [Deltaproteobacteria bacterium]
MMALWLLWGASWAWSADVDCAPYTPSRAAEDVSQFIATAQFDKIQTRVQRMEDGFRCLDSFGTTQSLATVYQVAGTAAFFLQDAKLADARFQRAVVMAPVVPFDAANLGTDPQHTFDASRDRVLARQTGILMADGPVVVNGAAFRTGASIPVVSGFYLVQHVGADGGIVSRTLNVTPDTEYRVGMADPERLLAERSLVAKRRRTSWVSSGALMVLSGGLYTVAVLQEDRLQSRTADAVEDPLARLQQITLATNLALGGAVVSFSSATWFGVRGYRAHRELQP